MKILKEILYTEDHEWVKLEGDNAYIGITDYAQKAMGDIVFVELPEVDTELNKDEVFGVLESVKAASDMFIPLSGKVLEVNEALVDDPSLVNTDSYGSWMLKLKLSDPSEIEKLLTSEEYEELCSKEE
jgi:glycine cleavage system H protein